MVYKAYNHKDFYCEVNGKSYLFTCWAENTRYGFRHLCRESGEYGKYTSKACYYNRTWERFQFETVLERAIEKAVPAEDKKAVYEILIEGKAQKVKKDAEAFFDRFQKAYNESTPGMKKALENVTLQTEEQAKSLLNTLEIVNLLKK